MVAGSAVRFTRLAGALPEEPELHLGPDCTARLRRARARRRPARGARPG